MNIEMWDKIRLSDYNVDLLWEMYHENSKLSKYDRSLSNEEILENMQVLSETQEYRGYKTVNLPNTFTSLRLSLADAITTRNSARNMVPSSISLENVATLLCYSYGITKQNKNSALPRSFRVVPSAGALYPLEIFFYSALIEGQSPGIYHYNPIMNNIQILDEGDKSISISESLVQKEIAFEASLIIFITAIFEKSTFKYSDRGYRFTLLEAGHVAQNLNLVANGLDLGCINLGGFFDRKVDDLLQLDGISQSTIYIVAIGKNDVK